MQIERHAFISYAHIDNKPMSEGDVGWVTRFHKVLAQMLAGRLGKEPSIWRDEALRSNTAFPAEIADKLHHTAVLISVLSPRYLKSDWCREELERFCSIAGEDGGLVVDNRCRVFKVVKLPPDKADDQALPRSIHDTLPYDFYVIEGDDPIELDPSFGEQYGQKFLRRVASVATDIKQVVASIGQSRDAPESAARPCVYLAATASDCRDARDMLATELARMGCTVLPDRSLPTDEPALVDEVRKMLARCTLSIHLVGAARGLVPDGASQRSLLEIQNELAVERARAARLARVIWLAAGAQAPQAEQAAFIARLHGDADAQFGADLITGDFETCRLAVRSAMARRERESAPEAAVPAPSAAAALRRAHVVMHAQDRRASVGFLRGLQRQRARVSLPVFSDDAAAAQQANEALLLECDEVWLYYGEGDEAWRFRQQREIDRIRALRGARTLAPETIVLAGADSDDKALLADLGDGVHRVLDLRAGFDSQHGVLPD